MHACFTATKLWQRFASSAVRGMSWSECILRACYHRVLHPDRSTETHTHAYSHTLTHTPKTHIRSRLVTTPQDLISDPRTNVRVDLSVPSTQHPASRHPSFKFRPHPAARCCRELLHALWGPAIRSKSKRKRHEAPLSTRGDGVLPGIRNHGRRPGLACRPSWLAAGPASPPLRLVTRSHSPSISLSHTHSRPPWE